MYKADEPFVFYTRVHANLLTGLKAKSLRELLDHLKTAPGSVIYHHTHHFLQQHQYLSPEPPNDFAYWVTEVLQEKRLGEKLASINICDFPSIRELRAKLVSIIEEYIAKNRPADRSVYEGEELHFIKSLSFVFPTHYTASSLEEFADILKKVTVHSIYYHMFEARLRLEKKTNDFSLWLETALDEGDLARKIARLDPYTRTMEGLRETILRLIRERLSKEQPNHAMSSKRSGR